MNIKRIVLFTTLAATLGSSAISMAQPVSKACDEARSSVKHHRVMPGAKSLSEEQKVEFHNSMKTLHKQMSPLLKEKIALGYQLKGKLATPGIEWSEVSQLIDKINTNNAKITTLRVKTQLQIFQKFGVMLPSPHKQSQFFYGKFPQKHLV